jgi:glycosyltransferase involved in cell wall biosynthesis
MDAMAGALGQLAGNPAKRKAIAETARAYTVANYSEDAMLQRYLNLYERHAQGESR